MKQIAKSLVVMGALAVAGSAVAEFGELSPYAGIDLQNSWMKMKSPFDSIAKKSFPGATLHLGTKFHENFGVEVGYHWSKQQSKDYTIANGTNFGAIPATGAANATNAAITGKTKIRRSGAHLDLVGFLPVADCFELMGSVGYGWIQPKISATAAATAGNAATTRVVDAIKGLSTKSKGVFRLGLGASYMITDMVGLRAKFGWESTSALRLKESNPATLSALNLNTKAFKSSITGSAGVFVKF